MSKIGFTEKIINALFIGILTLVVIRVLRIMILQLRTMLAAKHQQSQEIYVNLGSILLILILDHIINVAQILRIGLILSVFQ